MSSTELDPEDLVVGTLNEIVRDYGRIALDDAALLARLLPDLLAEWPRETRMIQAAASAQAARRLLERIAAGIPVDTAVADVSAVISASMLVNEAAASWITSRYALALGYRPTVGTSRPLAAMPGSASSTGGRAAAAPVTAAAGPSVVPVPLVAPVPPAADRQPRVPPPAGPHRRSRRGLIVLGAVIAAIGVAVVLSIWITSSPDAPPYDVGSCLLRNDNGPEPTSCQTPGAYRVVSRTSDQSKCPYAGQPYVRLIGTDAATQIVCLYPAN